MIRPALSIVLESSTVLESSAVLEPRTVLESSDVLQEDVVDGPVAGDDLCDDRPSMVSPLRNADWTLRAVCVGVDPDVLFVTGAAQRDAAKVCQACPVRLECLADALDNQIEYGVWGGMTERQRRAVLKKSPEVTSWRMVLEEARASVTQEAAS